MTRAGCCSSIGARLPGVCRPRRAGGAPAHEAGIPHVRSLHRVPQRPDHERRRGRVDRLRLARDDDGQLVARSVLAGERAPRDARSSGSRRRRSRTPARAATCRWSATPRRWTGGRRKVFAHLPFKARRDGGSLAEDGVSCSLCHQIGTARLGTPESFTGGFEIDPPDAQGNHREYGPYAVDPGHTLVMKTSTEGFVPAQAEHIRKLRDVRDLPHADYRDARSRRQAGRPAAGAGAVPGVAAQRLQGRRRAASRATCRWSRSLWRSRASSANRGSWRGTCSSAPTSSCSGCSTATATPSTSAALPSGARHRGGSHRTASRDAGGADHDRRSRRRSAAALEFDVSIENLGGHKLPTAYPSRRVWLHVDGPRLRRPCGVRVGPRQRRRVDRRATTTTPTRPSLRTALCGDSPAPTKCRSTRACSATPRARSRRDCSPASQYLKDNRLLPHGFDKRTAEAGHRRPWRRCGRSRISRAARDRVRYSVDGGGAVGAVHGGGGAAVSADRLPLGAEPEGLHAGGGATALHRVLRRHGVGRDRGARQRLPVAPTPATRLPTPATRADTRHPPADTQLPHLLQFPVPHGSVPDTQLLRHRPHRPRQVHARGSLPRDDRRAPEARDGSAGPRLDGSRARARHHDQGARRPADLPRGRRRDLHPEPDRHARPRGLLVRSDALAGGVAKGRC